MPVTTSTKNLSDLTDMHRRISEDDLRFTFTRCGGPGGQNVNKVATRVTLWFDLRGSEALTEAEKRRIHTKLGTRVTKAGLLFVVSMRHRTQRANRQAAIERFFELLADAIHRPKGRKTTVPPRRARERRLQEKRIHGGRKELRKPVSRSDAES